MKKLIALACSLLIIPLHGAQRSERKDDVTDESKSRVIIPSSASQNTLNDGLQKYIDFLHTIIPSSCTSPSHPFHPRSIARNYPRPSLTAPRTTHTEDTFPGAEERHALFANVLTVDAQSCKPAEEHNYKLAAILAAFKTYETNQTDTTKAAALDTMAVNVIALPKDEKEKTIRLFARYFGFINEQNQDTSDFEDILAGRIKSPEQPS